MANKTEDMIHELEKLRNEATALQEALCGDFRNYSDESNEIHNRFEMIKQDLDIIYLKINKKNKKND